MNEQAPLPQRPPRDLTGKPMIKSITEINPPRKMVIVKKPTFDLPEILSYDLGTLSCNPGILTSNDKSFVPDLHKDPPSPIPAPRTGKVRKSSVPLTFSEILAGPRSSGSPRSRASVPETENKNISENNREIRTKDKVREETANKRKKEGIRTEDTTKDEDTEGWKVVDKNRKRKQKKKKAEKEKMKNLKLNNEGVSNSTPPIPTSRSTLRSFEKSTAQLLLKKIPKSSAIMIKGKDDDFSYADALTRLRNIPLNQIGITTTKIKKTANGAVLIEFLVLTANKWPRNSVLRSRKS